MYPIAEAPVRHVNAYRPHARTPATTEYPTINRIMSAIPDVAEKNWHRAVFGQQ
jgi:hypothetical protein